MNMIPKITIGRADKIGGLKMTLEGIGSINPDRIRIVWKRNGTADIIAKRGTAGKEDYCVMSITVPTSNITVKNEVWVIHGLDENGNVWEDIRGQIE